MQLLSALLLFLTALFVFQVDTFAMAQEVFWTETTTVHGHGKARVEPVHYTVTGSATRVETSDEIIFIDYTAMTLYRLNRQNGQCKTIDFSVSGGNSQSAVVAKKVRALMAEIRVVETVGQRQIQGLSCHRKTALLGAGLFRLKTMAPITVKSLGQSFNEARGAYWVSANVDAWPVVQKMLPQRQQAFKGIPLLRRIDPLGLMQYLDGFIVMGQVKSTERSVSSSLVGSPLLRDDSLRIPTECTGNVL